LAVSAAQTFAQEKPDSGWRQLPLIANGKVAEGWQQVGWGAMVVDGDSLRTECDERGLGLSVYTREKLGNCQLRIVYRGQDARDNAGVFIRMDEGILKWVGKPSIAVKREANGKLSPEMLSKMREASEKEDGAWYAVHHGFEVQIMDSADEWHRTGSLYSLANATALPQPTGQWRTMIITLDGTKVLVEVDGQRLSSFDSAGKDIPARKNWTEPKRDYPRPEAGYIGLQTHDPGDVVFFKEVSVRPLSGNSAK
jgi:hypothetical protein